MPDIINLTHPYPDFQQGAVMQDSQFDANNAATRTKVNEVINELNVNAAKNTNVLNLNQTTEFTPVNPYEPATKIYVDSRDAVLDAARQVILNAHKISNEHDGQYYKKSLIDGFESTMQLAVNQNAADLIALQAMITNLNSTYSTDLERINAINQIIVDYEAADSDISALIGAKANTTDVYTKTQVDAMTLGSYKMSIESKFFTTTSAVPSIAIDVSGFNPEFDSISIYKGGLLMTENVDWKYNLAMDSFEPFDGSNWATETDFDWLVIRNLRVLLPSDQFEGSLIADGTILRSKLATAVTAELDSLRTDINSKATITKNAGTITTTGWIANAGDYALKLELSISGILATDWIDITIDKDSHDIAGDAEICPTVEEGVDTVTLFAQTAPASNIPFKWKVVR